MADLTVGPAALETTVPEHAFDFDRARKFQAEILGWIHGDGPPVAAVDAPTGSGKTAAFVEVIRNSSTSLIIYPTNALMEQQKTVLEDSNVSVAVVNADTLEKHGHARTEELLQYAQNPPFDAVLTNPDILQAVLQDMYMGVGQEMRFFEGFDSIVYDEFHFYDPLATSGLLLQIDVISRRSPNTDILLTSATPDESFLSFIEEQLQISVKTVQATYTDPDSDPAGTFRFETAVHRYEDGLRDSFDKAASLLAERVSALDSPDEPRAAIIFNSAALSNQFHDFVYQEYPDLFDVMRKDNGYDTRADHELTPEFAVLNTTSKGEVGLHFDLDLLLMQNPGNAYQFLQRFGRAGRESPASVHIFGLKEVAWSSELSFESLVEAVYKSLPAPAMNQDRLRSLVGLRAAHAVTSREGEGWLTGEVRSDFERVEEFDRWRWVIKAIEEESQADRGPLDPQLERGEKASLEIAQAAIEGLRSLRGQTPDVAIRYPRGDTEAVTMYDILSALRQYGLKESKESELVLGGDSKGLLVEFPGYQDSLDWEQSHRAIENQLETKACDYLDNGQFDLTELDYETLALLFRILPLADLLLPERIKTGVHELEFANGEVTRVENPDESGQRNR